MMYRGHGLLPLLCLACLILCTSYNVRKFGNNVKTQNSQLHVSTTHSPTHELTTLSPASTLLRGELELPLLSKYDKELLSQGERIQRQYRNGRSGSGFVVVDIEVPAEKVYDALTKFQMYNQMIPTVKEVRIYSSNSTTTEVKYICF